MIVTVVLAVCLVVIAVSNLTCGLYNRRLYDQAFTLVETLCKDLCKNRPVSLSVDRVSLLDFCYGGGRSVLSFIDL